MNIDLRNISPEFENKVNEIKKEYQIGTNSKAVEFCTVNYLNQMKLISDLKKQLDDKTQELVFLQNNVYHFKKALDNLIT